MEWFKLSEVPIPESELEVVAYHPNWVDEDFNPRGTRAGFMLNAGHSEQEFVSAKWCNHCDEYHTVYSGDGIYGANQTPVESEKVLPTHWMYIVKPLT